MSFPQPDTIALEHSNRLIQLIRHEIQREEGFISFARFMDLALYAPGLGYYSAGAHKLGSKGDFITAPELSPLFAKCLARQCQQVLNQVKNADILELGAGSGALARDLLLELETLNSLPEHYYILEVSADLKERQKTLLKSSCSHLFSRVIWLESLPTEEFSGIILANEVLDALPFHCFRVEDQQVYERSVTWDENQFTWKTTSSNSSGFLSAISTIQTECQFENGYESEINLLLTPFIRSLANILKQGVLLFLDYGYGRREYYRPERAQGTMMCFYQHHRHSDPFMLVGLQDITAHIDFTTVAESAISTGLSLSGFTTQAYFLFACGLLEIAEADTLSEKEKFRQNQAIKVLTLPSQMGETIKAISFTKDFNIPLLGFSLHDLRRDL